MAEGSGGRLQAVRLPDLGRRRPGREHGVDHVARPPAATPRPGFAAPPGKQFAPLFAGGEEQDLGVEPGRGGPPSVRAATVASAMNRGAPAPARRWASPSRSETTVTERPVSANARSGEASRAAPRTAAVAIVAASAARMPRITATRRVTAPATPQPRRAPL